jgi:hypothetical protein
MMNLRNILLLLITVSTSTFAFADKTVCKASGVERHIEVVSLADGKDVPCEVRYTKQGDTKTLWTAENDASYCLTKAKGLAEKLSAAGWDCGMSASQTQEAAPMAQKAEADDMAKTVTDEPAGQKKPCCEGKKETCKACEKSDRAYKKKMRKKARAEKRAEKRRAKEMSDTEDTKEEMQ